MDFRRLTLDELTLEDERSFKHVALYPRLRDLLVRDAYRFRVPPAGETRPWDEALLLNLTFWDATEHGDVLTHDRIPADTVAHVAWHHAAGRALPTVDGARSRRDALFFGEAVASAFDLYLVGRLLGHAPESDFLQTQVPAMADVAASAGVTDDEFERMLSEIAAAPERAFEDLRALLFDATLALTACTRVDDAAAVLAGLRGRRFSTLLHHYALSNWVLYGRAYGDGAPDPAVRTLDATLRSAGAGSLDVLDRAWLDGTPARARVATLAAMHCAVQVSRAEDTPREGTITRVDSDAFSLETASAIVRIELADLAPAHLAFRPVPDAPWMPYRPSAEPPTLTTTADSSRAPSR